MDGQTDRSTDRQTDFQVETDENAMVSNSNETSLTGQSCVLTVSLRVLAMAIDVSDTWKDRYLAQNLFVDR